MSGMTRRQKKYWNMTAQELAEATKEFDQEGIAETFRDMTAAEEAAWRAATTKRRRGRLPQGKGVKKISLGIEADLLKRADALARQRGTTRAQLVAESLETVLARIGT